MEEGKTPEARLVDDAFRDNIRAFLVRAELLTRELHDVSADTLRDMDLNSLLMAVLVYELHELRELLARQNR